MLRHEQAEASAGVRGVFVADGARQLFLTTQSARGRGWNEYDTTAHGTDPAYGERNTRADAERCRELGAIAAPSALVFGAHERRLGGTCCGQNVRRVRRLSVP